MTAVSAQEKAAVASIGGAYNDFASTLGTLSVRVSYAVDHDDCQVIPMNVVIGGVAVDIHPDYFTEWQIDAWAKQAEADFDRCCQQIADDFAIDAYQAAREAA